MKELFEGLYIKNTIIEKLPFSFEIMAGDNLFSTCAKYSEKLASLGFLRFSDIFRWYRNGTFGLKWVKKLENWGKNA